MPPKIYTRNCEITENVSFPKGMHRIAMGIEYKGSDFSGFQSQRTGVPTVQQGIEKALSAICDEPITLVCAGRTDKGVHATGQVVHFDTRAVRPEKAWLRGANTQLPDGVSITWAQQVDPFFHSRFSAQSRCYRYVIHNTPTRSALLRHMVTWDRRRFDLEAMKEGSRHLLGEHDFSAFRGADCQARNPVRLMQRIDIHKHKDFIVIEVQATAFLYHMVRNIAGVLLAVACEAKPPQWVAQVLASKDRKQADVTAPADGLYLVKVSYPEKFALPQQSKGPYFLPEVL